MSKWDTACDTSKPNRFALKWKWPKSSKFSTFTQKLDVNPLTNQRGSRDILSSENQNIENIRSLYSPYFPLDIVRDYVMMALNEAVEVNQVHNRDPIGGSNENLFLYVKTGHVQNRMCSTLFILFRKLRSWTAILQNSLSSLQNNSHFFQAPHKARWSIASRWDAQKRRYY